jgi:hypothetical protein
MCLRYQLTFLVFFLFFVVVEVYNGKHIIIAKEVPVAPFPSNAYFLSGYISLGNKFIVSYRKLKNKKAKKIIKKLVVVYGTYYLLYNDCILLKECTFRSWAPCLFSLSFCL